MLFLPCIFKLQLSKLQSGKWSLCSSYGSDIGQWKNRYSVTGRWYRYLDRAITAICKITLNGHLSAYWYMPNLYTNRWPLKKSDSYNVFHSSLSFSLLKLPLLKITVGTMFYLLIRLEQWVSDVSMLHAFCVQTRLMVSDFCRGSKHLSSLGFSKVKIENLQEN